MAALTAGVTWLAVSPSTAGACKKKEPTLLSPDTVAAYCDDHTSLRLNEGGGTSRVAEESNKLAMAAGEMARQLGLTGLAAARSVLGPVADLGGVGATWGMSSLAAASPAPFPMAPGYGEMHDLATMAEVPELPELPALPETPVGAVLPAEMSLGGHAVESPTDLKQPVNEIGGGLVSKLLPKAVDGVEGISTLPGGHPAIDGFGGLLGHLNPL